jgi:isoleucyl-tRNA synthetase
MDYKDSLNLPKTDFQMKAELAKREPAQLRRWEGEGLYEKIKATREGRVAYTLHDGPPYANGNIHIGHALNKILKDVVIKSRFMSGFAVDYVPGWDCHGLPIELQVEKKLGKEKAELSKADIRRRCREYAGKFVDIQREEFKRLGIFGDWDNPYLTMDYKYQAFIMRELSRVNDKGLIYKGKKPVHWCASCRTALAEAEVEHADKTSPTVFVKFKVKDARGKLPDGASFVIWTTTPWTLPANLAIAVNPRLSYRLVKTPVGELVIVEELISGCMESFGFEEEDFAIGTESIKGSEFEGIVCEHPFIDRESKVLLGDFVTIEAGTGCVHIAPGHGHDDYVLGLKNGLAAYAPVDDGGKFTKDFPEFEGQFVFKANKGIIELLSERSALLHTGELSHSYPHCWRCKRPVIFRATAQWFVSMDALRENALKAIDDVEWIPGWGRERIYGMIEKRPDWCLSRQRVWGVPIPALRCKSCEESFLDKGLMKSLEKAFETEGADIWFEKDLSELIPDEGIDCGHCGKSGSADDFTKEEDILDVWFDSGVSFSAVLEARENLSDVADLYLEGSDQHRGWFHSALLASVATRARAPYKAVLTHGFVVDGAGKKMSKSTGNVISPDEVIKKYGVDVLRLWVAGEDYRDDIRISDEILKRLGEAYRRIRNTFRYILGNISDFDPKTNAVEFSELGELDRLTLHRLNILIERVLHAYESSEFHVIYHQVHNFCAVELSAFYLDILKDRLYTSARDSKGRRAAQTTMHIVLDTLVRLLAPVLVFTTEEAWGYMPATEPGTKCESVHLSSFPKVREEWRDVVLEEKYERLLKVKETLSWHMEVARKEKVIGHSLDAHIIIKPTEELRELVTAEAETLKDMLIASSLLVVSELPDELTVYTDDKADAAGRLKGFSVAIAKAEGEKCERCWKISTKVGQDSAHPTICEKCLDAIS